MTATEIPVQLTVNGTSRTVSVEPRRTLLDCLRDDLGLKGTHVGCEHGVCGACNVWLDGRLARSCLMFAFHADGAAVRTIEGIEGADGALSELQEAMCARHGMQCGYCTPGVIMTLEKLLEDTPDADDDAIVDALSGNICRCTGYQQIIEAARSLSRREHAGPEHS